MDAIQIRKVLEMSPSDTLLRVSGWVRTKRDSKGFSFIEINDGSCLQSLQVVADTTVVNYQNEVVKLTTGSSLSIEGLLVESPGKGQKVEMRAKTVIVYG